MPGERVDCVVIGAGVIGLACARALAQAGREVIVLEAENAFGTVTSARNSEVIHAGIYYPTGSLRASLCVRGKAMLYDYCASHGVNHRRCGKLIVAQNDAEVAQLQIIEQRARANGVHDLQWLSRDEALALEPQLRLHPRIAVARHRHRRQPRADAGAAGRRADRRRDAGAAVAGVARRRHAAGHRVASGRRDRDHLAGRCGGQQRRPWRAGAGGGHARPGSAARAAALLRQGLLLHARRPLAVFAPGVSGAQASRAISVST